MGQSSRKPWRIAFPDNNDAYAKFLFSFISSHFDVALDPVDPDIVFFGVHPGYDFLKYRRALKVFLSEENIVPDFNLADFGFGYAHLDFGDRYLRMPNFVLHPEYDDLVARNRSVPPATDQPRRFCNFIYSHQRGDPARAKLFEAISAYKPVEARGRLFQNAPPLKYTTDHPDWRREKLAVLGSYKFTIACENARSPGYVTEKLTDAIAAHTIPIYWGDPGVTREFNKDRMIVVEDIDDLAPVLDRVRELDQDRSRYDEVVSAPVFTPDQLASAVRVQAVVDFLSTIFSSVDTTRGRYLSQKLYYERLHRMWTRDSLFEGVKRTRGWHFAGRIARFLRLHG